MKRSTIEARKRFAAELHARDARALSGGASRAVGSGTDLRSSAEPSSAVAKSEVSLAPTDEELLVRYRMRRWWLDRYTLAEIRELAECLQ